MTPTTLRDFIAAGFLRSDTGQKLQPTPLLDSLVEAYESDCRSTAVCAPRQQGKSTSVAAIVLYELLMVPHAYVVWLAPAGHTAEAVLAQKIRKPLRSNPLTSDLDLQISKTMITNPQTGACVEIVPPSEASAPGRRLSLLVTDEARSVPEEAIEVIRPALATGGKFIAIGSPGRPKSWWWRQVFEPAPKAKVIQFSGTDINPAVDRDFVEAEKARLGRTAWGRLLAEREWCGRWTDLAENPLVSVDDVTRASREDVPDLAPGDHVMIAADLSLSKDLTSIVACARRGDQYRVLPGGVFVWDPSKQGRVDLDVVEKRIALMAHKFKARRVVLDSYQGELLGQRLRRQGVKVRMQPVSAAYNREIFENLAGLLGESRVTWPRNERLESEILNLEVTETEGGWKVRDHDKRLHRDVSFSLAACLKELVASGMATFNREPHFEIGQGRQRTPREKIEIELRRDDLKEAIGDDRTNKILKLERQYHASADRLLRASASRS